MGFSFTSITHGHIVGAKHGMHMLSKTVAVIFTFEHALPSSEKNETHVSDLNSLYIYTCSSYKEDYVRFRHDIDQLCGMVSFAKVTILNHFSKALNLILLRSRTLLLAVDTICARVTG